MRKRTLNLGGKLMSLETPVVMGIVNLTPDSFYATSRVQEEDALRQRVATIVHQGGGIVDLGAYSTRPGATPVSAEQERERLRPALRLLRDEYPEVPVSVDTFRADIARWAVEEYGVAIINDVSGGELDHDMYATVARLDVPYVLMHMRGTPETMASLTQYDDLVIDILDYFIDRVARLHDLGAHDIIIDPGFGFSKTLEQNYELLTALPRFGEALELPLLVGISRKSMIYRTLDITPEESLNGTSILNTYSLLHGADILRVHDVREAVECIRLVECLQRASCPESCVHTIDIDRALP